MFKSLYKLSIEGKDVQRFIKLLYKRGITFNRLYLSNNKYYVVVDVSNYKKIIDVKTTYIIKIERVYGNLYIKQLFNNNKIFIISFLFSVVLLFVLSNIIFDIEIVHSDKKIVNLIREELNKNDIKKYTIAKNYDERSAIKESILDNNRDSLEWLEIERVGVKYIIRLDKRIINSKKEDNNICNIVADRSGIILKIVADKGEIVKKVNDYVKKGDIIISGSIHKGEDVKDNVSASGNVYAEVWYKVKVVLPINYYEEKNTNNSEKALSIRFINKEVNLFKRKNYIYENVNSKLLFSDFFNLFNIYYNNIEEKYVNDELNTIINEADAVKMAREKIEERLSNEEYIISQKKLKTTLNDSTITIEVFFKVYENISSKSYYSVEGS